MLLFIPRTLCALRRVVAKNGHARFGATQGIRVWSANGMYRAEATDGRRAVVVQGAVPESQPWPGLKELPDDAFEAIVLPKDLDRASKLGGEWLQRSGLVGVATRGNVVSLGLGEDVVTASVVDGRFPAIDQVIPRKPPLFSFRVDPTLFAETLLTIANLLPQAPVQLFYYGDGMPLGLCAGEGGTFVDALVVPLTMAQPQRAEVPEEPEQEEAERTDEAEEEEAMQEAEPEAPQATETSPETPAQPTSEQQPATDEKPSRRRRRKTAKA